MNENIVFYLKNEDEPSIYCNNLWFQIVSVMSYITDVDLLIHINL